MTEDDLNVAYSDPMIGSGKPFMVVGYRTRAPKNPILIQMINSDKEYVIPIPALRRCVEAAKKKWNEHYPGFGEQT